MQLKLSLPLLAGSVFVGLLTQNVDALPVARYLGFVSLPLKPLEQRSDVHPQVLLQQNINRAQRRLARMTGRAEPSSDQLRDNLIKRLESVHGLSKRFNRKHIFSQKKANKKAPKNRKAAAAPVNDVSNPTGVTPANPPTGKDSLGLNIEGNDIGYLATVQIGTPPTDFLLLMDSGSADMWVGSENCKSLAGGGCGNHKFLGTTASQTFVDSGVPWNITYGTGSVSGTKVSDDIIVAGLKLANHQFGVADTESVEFSDNSTPFDGLMGLAQSLISEQQNPTPIDSLAQGNLVNAAITSYKIPRLADNKNDGEITFGGLDTTKFDSATLVTLDNVSPAGFWEADMDAVTVDGTDVGLKGRTAILDTGTTLIIAPGTDANTIHAAIPGSKSDGQGGFTVPCTTTSSVALTFGGTSFTIDPRDIAFQPLDPANPTGDCISGISSGNIGGATEWLVGDVFLKNAYFSTDVGKNQIQLAKLV